MVGQFFTGSITSETNNRTLLLPFKYAGNAESYF